MARRKRLTDTSSGLSSGPSSGPAPAPPPPSRAPIAQVAGEASASAALGEMSDMLLAARAEGRMIERLPLAVIDDTHLVRDRVARDDEDMAALIASIEARGQQTPIEVVALPAPREGLTHGLISGARRLAALRHLHGLTGEDRFATVQARVIAPADAQAAYVAMVEENEIRAALSLYEKARITLRAVHEGVYPTTRAALRGLFGAVSRSRRSKIGSFIELVEPLDGRLRFPAAIPEKLGLGLAQALPDHHFAKAVKLALQRADAATPEAELAVLNRALRDWRRAQPKGSGGAAPVPAGGASRGPRITGPDPESVARRLAASEVRARLDAGAGQITLTGGGVNAALLAELKTWLKTRRS